MSTYQRMVTTKNNRKLSSSGMTSNYSSDSLADPGYESRILHLADWRVVLLGDLFELVMSVKLNLPSQIPELLLETGFNQVDRTVVNSELSLAVASRCQARGAQGTEGNIPDRL